MLKTTRLSKMLTFKVLEVNNNKIVGDGHRLIKKSTKSKFKL